MSSSPRIAIVIYTVYGHIAKLAESIKEGIVEAGGNATIYQCAETLTEEVLTLIKAPPKPNYPLIQANDLPNFDGFLFGVPTRFGNMPVQMKALWDATGPLWYKRSLHGKYAGVFVSTGSLAGGQEVTVMNMVSTFAHHGTIFVPLGYERCQAELTNVEEVRGGSPWGAGTIVGPTHTMQPTKSELAIARAQGMNFYETLAKVKF
ncbi:NADH:quinone oxidoreductase [Amanita muscaria]|uniref:Benzoquinone reductase n=1 Tax=Amanita muscaria (strain Koide BX008) TaxID=946122 RepID=A0A0C2WNH5_AMAMK|nr:benzoquinone reductase [Amanita muscaria Koide BX008]